MEPRPPTGHSRPLRSGTALEINSFPGRLDLDDELIYRARRAGVRSAISTDAHAVRTLAT